jgi:outer membrane protein TolC
MTPTKLSRTRPLRLVLLSLVGVLCSSCLTKEQAVAEVDAEAYDAIAEKQEAFYGSRPAFRVEPSQHRVVLDAIDEATGQVIPGKSLSLNLATILDIAAVNSRTFQQSKENLFRSALALMREREDFRLRPAGLFDGSVSSSRSSETLSSGTEFGITRLLETGGSYALSAGLDFFRFLNNPTSETLASFINLSITLPFLRNAGREVAYENLVQADRDLLYGLRSFERFKQTHGVEVISRYLRVLSQSQRIVNEEANLRSLELARQQAEDRFAEGRTRGFEVDQNLQAELRGKSRLINARQSLEAALDNLKDLIGVPVDLPVTISIEDLKALDALLLGNDELTETKLITAALKNRLDFRNVVDAVADRGRRVHVAENQLLPDFTLRLNARPVSDGLRPLRYNYQDGTYSANFDMDLALDRDLESIALRSSIIDMEAALRNQEDSREGVKFDVRQALRNLKQSLENYQVAQSALKLANKRVFSTQELRDLNRATTRDFLEAQDALVSSENDLVDAKVAYRIAYLELLRDIGVIAVSPEGLDHDTSHTLLKAALQ